MFFFTQKRFSPFLGVNVSANTGLSEFQVDNFYQTATFRIRPDISAYLRAGFQLKLFDIDWYWTFGISENLLHKRAEHVSGDYDIELQRVADILLPRGFEFSFGCKFAIFKTNRLFN